MIPKLRFIRDTVSASIIVTFFSVQFTVINLASYQILHILTIRLEICPIASKRANAMAVVHSTASHLQVMRE